MAGAIVLVVVLLLFPMMVAMSGTIAALILGQVLTDDAEQSHEGSELIDLNI